MPENHRIKEDKEELDSQIKALEKWERKLHKFSIDIWQASLDQRTRLARSGVLKQKSKFLKNAELAHKIREKIRAESSLNPVILAREAALLGVEQLLVNLIVSLVAPELALFTVGSKIYKGSRATGRVANIISKFAIKEAAVTPTWKGLEAYLRSTDAWKKLDGYLRSTELGTKHLEALTATLRTSTIVEYQPKFLQSTATSPSFNQTPSEPTLTSKMADQKSMEQLRLIISAIVVKSKTVASLSKPESTQKQAASAPSAFEITMPTIILDAFPLANQPQSYTPPQYDERGRMVGSIMGTQFQINQTGTLDVSLDTSEGVPHAQITHGFFSEKLGKQMSLSYGLMLDERGITHTGSASIQSSADTTFKANVAYGGTSLIGLGFTTSNPIVIGVAAGVAVAGGVGYGLYRLIKKIETKPLAGIEAIGSDNVKQTKELTKAVKTYQKTPSAQNKDALAQKLKTCLRLQLKTGKEILYAMDYALTHGNDSVLNHPQKVVACYQSALNVTIDAIETAHQAGDFFVARQLTQQAIRHFPQYQQNFKQFDITLQCRQKAQQLYETCQTYNVACETGNYQIASQMASQSPILSAHFNNVEVRLEVAINLLEQKGVDAGNQWMQDAFPVQDNNGDVRTRYAKAQYDLGYTDAAKQTAEATLSLTPNLTGADQEICRLIILHTALKQPQTAQTADILVQAQSLVELAKVQLLTEQGKALLLYAKDLLWDQQQASGNSDPTLAEMTHRLLLNPQLSSVELAKCYGQLASDPGISKEKSFELYQNGLALDPINSDLVNGVAAGHGERLHFSLAFDVYKQAKRQLAERISQSTKDGDTTSAEHYKADLKKIRTQENRTTATQLQITQFGVTLLSKAIQKGCDYWESSAAKKTKVGVQVGATIVGSYLSHRLQQVTAKPQAHRQLLGNLASIFGAFSLAADVVENWCDETSIKDCQDFSLAMNAMGMGLGMTASGVELTAHLTTAKTLNTGTVALSTLGVLIPAAALANTFYFKPNREAGRAPMHLGGILLEGACNGLTSTPMAMLSFGLASEAAITALWTGTMHALGYGATVGAVANVTAGAISAAAGASATGSSIIAWSGTVATFVGAHAVAFAVGGAVILVFAAGAYYNHQWYANRLHNIEVKLKAGGLANRLEAERLLAEILTFDSKHKDALAYHEAITTFVAELNKHYQQSHSAREQYIFSLQEVLKPESELSRFFTALTTTLYPHAPEMMMQYSEKYVAQMRANITPSRIYGPQYQEWIKILQCYFEQGNNLKIIPQKIRTTKESTEKALKEDATFIVEEKKADNLLPGQREALEAQSREIQANLGVIHTQVVEHEKQLIDTGLMACCDHIDGLMASSSDLPALLLKRHKESMRELREDAVIEAGGAVVMCAIDQLSSMCRQPQKSIPQWPIEVIHPPQLPSVNPFHQKPSIFSSAQVFFKPNKPTPSSGVFYAKPAI